MQYSLVIPYFRTPEITRLCLYSIYKYARGQPEVIVVDNAPQSAESAMLEEFTEIKLLKNATAARGSAANFEALDLGLDAASNDLVGLLHSDVVFLHEGWDLECFGRLERAKLGALGTFERESNPFRPLRQRVRDRWRHLLHARRPAADSRGKLMVHFLLTRRSALRAMGFRFAAEGHVLPCHYGAVGQPVEVLSLVEASSVFWHTSNVTSLLTGQMDDPRLAAIYRDKRKRFLSDPRIREAFGPVLPKP